MKFDPIRYRRELLVEKMRNHSGYEDQECIRHVRGNKKGITYELAVGKEWKKMKLTSSEVERIMKDLS